MKKEQRFRFGRAKRSLGLLLTILMAFMFCVWDGAAAAVPVLAGEGLQDEGEKNGFLSLEGNEEPDAEAAAEQRGIMDSELASSLLGELADLIDRGERKIRDCDVAKIPDKTWTGRAITPSVSITYLGRRLKRGTDYTLSYFDNVRVGTARVRITGKGRYKGTRTVTFKIVRKGSGSSGSTSGNSSGTSSAKTSSEKFSVRLSRTSYVYDGQYHKPAVKVTVRGKDVPRKYYTVKYNNNRSVGKATAVVTGKGAYKGCSGTASFKISLKNAAITGLRSNAKGELTVTVRKDTQADGYQIEVSTRKSFGGSIKKAALRNSGSRTIEGLKSGTRYYVRVRSFKKVGSSNWYSNYSAIRSVVVK